MSKHRTLQILASSLVDGSQFQSFITKFPPGMLAEIQCALRHIEEGGDMRTVNYTRKDCNLRASNSPQLTLLPTFCFCCGGRKSGSWFSPPRFLPR